MANRNFTQDSYGLEKAPVTIYATVDGNGTGAPILRAWQTSVTGGAGSYIAAPATGYKGVKSVSRSAQGKYLFTLQDNYVRLLGMGTMFKAIDGLTSPLAQDVFVSAEAVVSTSAPTVTVNFTNTAGSSSNVDPGTNDRIFFTFLLSNSSAQ